MIGNQKIIALCLSRIQDEVSQEFITALNDAVTQKDYRLFVYNTCLPLDEEAFRQDPQMSVYDFIDYSVVDIVMVHEEFMRCQSATDYLIEKAKKAGKIVLVVGERHEGCINILFDREKGFAEAVRHMVEYHKYTKLHFMAGIKGNPFSEQRLEAFRNVLSENGLDFDESMVSYGDFWSGPTEIAMEKILETGDLPQAIICANDMMAITVSDVLQKHGVRMPEEVAVTGFDGIEQIKFTSPRITTSVCDVKDFARTVVDVLSESDLCAGQTRTVFVPAKLAIGESCGCSGLKPERVADYLYLANDHFYRYQDEDLTLANITAQIQRCETLAQVAKQMRQGIFYDMTCIVEKEYMDETVDYVYDTEDEKPLDRDMMLLFDTNYGEDFHPHIFPLNSIIPGLNEALENKKALIFTALHYMEAPIGYLCFHFGKLEYGNYIKIPQINTAFNNAIGAYRNLRYEHYLMQRIDEMYKADPLTGLYNRRAFDVEYKGLLHSVGEDKTLTVLMADLDRLKYVNDNFGHKEGDFAIQTVAQGLQTVCPAGSLFTRFGGDEMLGVCRGRLDVDALQAEFARFFESFNKRSKKPYKVEVSIGINVTKPDEVLDFEQLVEKVDKLMYEEKEHHRAARGQKGSR